MSDATPYLGRLPKPSATPGADQRIDLMIGVLDCAGDPCVTNQHVSTIPSRRVFRHSLSTLVLDAIDGANPLFRACVGKGSFAVRRECVPTLPLLTNLMAGLV